MRPERPPQGERGDVKPREEISELCRAFLGGLERVLGGKLYGVYLYGAVTFPETEHTGDIDFHVILSVPPSEEERERLLTLHRDLAERFPPLGGELDGYYLLLEDARRSSPPSHLLLPDTRDDSWALHRAHLLAGQCIVLFGPDPKTVYREPTTEAIAGALRGELAYVSSHLEPYPAYCVLNLCRLMYSHETGNVVTSKAAAAAWAKTVWPEWRSLVLLAEAAYARAESGAEVDALTEQLPGFYAFALARIEERSL
jgi:predicted nucleotidyltransferase